MNFNKLLKIQKYFWGKTAAEQTFNALSRIFDNFRKVFRTTSSFFKMAATKSTEL